jgi:hypothetical protein
MKLSINIPYWHTSEDRYNGLLFVIGKISKFLVELKKHNIECVFNIFDFSEIKKIENSIHIPYPISEYKRAEKINHIIKYNCDNICPEIFCLFDSDIFFDEESYVNIINLINNFDKKFFYVGRVNDIIFDGNVQLDMNNLKLTGRYHSRKRDVFGLGGVYFINFDELHTIGGYDENFITWGGEDDDLGNRFARKRIFRQNLDCDFYHLPHGRAQEVDWGQYERQCKLIAQNVTFKPSRILSN